MPTVVGSFRNHAVELPNKNEHLPVCCFPQSVGQHTIRRPGSSNSEQAVVFWHVPTPA